MVINIHLTLWRQAVADTKKTSVGAGIENFKKMNVREKAAVQARFEALQREAGVPPKTPKSTRVKTPKSTRVKTPKSTRAKTPKSTRAKTPKSTRTKTPKSTRARAKK